MADAAAQVLTQEDEHAPQAPPTGAKDGGDTQIASFYRNDSVGNERRPPKGFDGRTLWVDEWSR